MICPPPSPADAGRLMSGYARLRDSWVNPPRLKKKKTPPAVLPVSDCCRAPPGDVSPPEDGERAQQGAGQAVMPDPPIPNYHPAFP